MCLIAPIIISSTTPASKIPIIKMINGEKLPIVSVVLLAMLDVKLSGNVIIVSIIRRVQSPYILAIQTLSFRYHRN